MLAPGWGTGTRGGSPPGVKPVSVLVAGPRELGSKMLPRRRGRERVGISSVAKLGSDGECPRMRGRAGEEWEVDFRASHILGL